MDYWSGIFRTIEAVTGEAFLPQAEPQALAGGCINVSHRVSDGRREFFVKTNSVDRLGMFEAEAAGLKELMSSAAIRVPTPLDSGVAGDRAFLIMEFVRPGAPRHGSAALAGRSLAQMHRHTQGRFGWYRDNTIGATPQPNGQCTDWAEFWREKRLEFQLGLAARNGHGGRLQSRGEQLLDRLPALVGNAPVPSLLHGDLWSGNIFFDGRGDPVLFDPAVYYGDREADLAMTELFGGFGPDFYAAYREAWPLDAGYPERKLVYNLYHILNHLNLFGAGYLAQAERMIERLLAASG